MTDVVGQSMLDRLRPFLAAPQPLSEALRRAIVDAQPVQHLLREGSAIPEAEVGWLDALKMHRLPPLFWEICPDPEGTPGLDFGQPALTAMIPDQQTAQFHIAMSSSKRIIASRHGRIYVPENAYYDFRRRFRETLSKAYNEFFGLLRSGVLYAQGFHRSCKRTERLDVGLFESQADYFIHLHDDDVYAHDGQLAYRAVKIGIADKAQEDNFPVFRDPRGGQNLSDWTEIAKHFIAHLHYSSQGWPRNHAEAVRVVKNIIAYLGWSVSKDETISKAMMREIPLLWALFPKQGVAAGVPRFHGLTKNPVADEVESDR